MFIKTGRVKCNGKCLKHIADASDCALDLYHLKFVVSRKFKLKKTTKIVAIPEIKPWQ